jgi:hypothetical protein
MATKKAFVSHGVIKVINCPQCGSTHEALELQYVYPPIKISMDGTTPVLYNLVANCPDTGEVVYVSVDL